MKIDDLFTDLADGKMLMKLLEIISGEKIGKPNKGVLRVQKMENVSRCLTFLSTKVCKALLGLKNIRQLGMKKIELFLRNKRRKRQACKVRAEMLFTCRI